MPLDLFLIAAEPSGDLLGAELVEALLEMRPDLRIAGVAGPKLRSLPILPLFPMEKLQVMGFVDVFLALPSLWSTFHEVREKILELQPKAVLLIDYPGFNLRLEASLRKKGYRGKLIHYVSPSVWAWGKKRIPQMAGTLDLLLTLFPFEKNFFIPLVVQKSAFEPRQGCRKSIDGGGGSIETCSIETYTPLPRRSISGAFTRLKSRFLNHERYTSTPLRVEFVGHPLAKLAKLPRNEQKILALFPGSRKKEIERTFPMQLEAAKRLCAEDPEVRVGVSIASRSVEPLIAALCQKVNLPVHFYSPERKQELFQSAKAAIATSGTITLELALCQIPTLVTYGVGALDRFIVQKLLSINLPFYCIVNILLAQELFPEFFGPNLRLDRLTHALESIWRDQETRDRIVRGCRQVQAALGAQDPAKEAAGFISSLVGKEWV